MRSRAEAVVVAHGLWMPGSETWLLRRRFERAGYNAYLFKYSTVAVGLDSNALLLSNFLGRLPESTIHLIGYSLGGVISVCMLRDHATERCGRLVCLGSPLNGSASARALLALPGGRQLLGRSMIELTERAGLGAWGGQVDLGVVAGDLGIGLGRILGAFDGPNDGTVAVEETRIDGAADHIVRRVSHTSMLFSGRVTDDALRFIRTGEFDHA
jgi:pimeloyl-ACP methyl ester carboxylesterase